MMQFPTGTGAADFGASAGTSTDEAQAPAETGMQPEAAPETSEATAQPAGSSENTDDAEATGRPSREGRGGFSQGGGMPGGMSFSGFGGFEQQTDQTGLWIQVAVCAALLIAAVVLISKASNHN